MPRTIEYEELRELATWLNRERSRLDWALREVQLSKDLAAAREIARQAIHRDSQVIAPAFMRPHLPGYHLVGPPQWWDDAT